MISPLPHRLPESHKGNYGHVLIVGGDIGMGGAACLSAEAALRVGAGLVTVITRSEHVPALLARCPEVMCYGISEVSKNEQMITELLKKVTVCVVGPGLGQSPWSKEIFHSVLKQKMLSCVVDGGALGLLSRISDFRHNWVLTPHPGEAGRLLNCSISEVQADRKKTVRELQKERGGVVVLKGAGTLVCDEHINSIYENDTHNPAMATAGMGDVLSGVIGGLIAQGCSLTEAASYGVWLHARAGKLALQDTSIATLGNRRSLLAHELFPYLSFS